MNVKDVIDALSERGIAVESRNVIKNGVTLTGIFLVTDSRIQPTVYFEDFKDMELGAAVSMIESELKKADSASQRKKYENIDEILKNVTTKDIKACICGADRVTKDAIFKNWLDLSLYMRVYISSDASVVLSEEVKKLSALSEYDNEDLFDIALKNSFEDVKVVDETLSIIGLLDNELANGHMDLQTYQAIRDDVLRKKISIYVIANNNNNYGAVQMCNSLTLAEVAKKLDADLFIIPSSIHEIIIAKADDNSIAEYIRPMIETVNNTEIQPTEILSNNLYYYSREDMKVSIAK